MECLYTHTWNVMRIYKHEMLYKHTSNMECYAHTHTWNAMHRKRILIPSRTMNSADK